MSIMKTNKLFTIGMALLFGAGVTFTSCVDTESSLVDFNPELDSPNDTVYSFLGILNKMQVVADRTLILGEVRGDLASVTDAGTTDLRNLSNFTAGADNSYNEPADYYAIIQNCNYYITHADLNLTTNGEQVFLREYAAVKAYRAWAYLQLAIYYGRVPFFTEPLMTEAEADPSLYPKYGIEEICRYFIDDLAPYVETKTPVLGGSFSSYYIPVRVLLGDLCLWSGRYQEAAQYYHDYLTHVDNPRPVGTSSVRWMDYEFKSYSNGYGSGSPILSYIPMETSEYDGIISYLDDVFESTDDNKFYYQVTASSALAQLSAAQRYVLIYTDPATSLPDTISPPEDMVYADGMMRGDLRYSSYMSTGKGTGNDGYSKEVQTITKINTTMVQLYRVSAVYLRMAEAYNRAGLPESAFAILKHGLYTDVISKYISQAEKDRAGNLLSWSQYEFDKNNTQGIHAFGSGNSDADTTYVIPAGLSTLEDSILYVEDKICDEMALEQAFDGTRFGDLQRIALHRNDPTFLARKIANRNGKDAFDSELYSRLCDRNNWYLPLE